MKYYRIEEFHLRGLLELAHEARALSQGGVDNWEGYGESINNYIQDCSAIDFQEYESIEEVVDEDIKHYPICSCTDTKSPTFDEIVSLLEV